MQQKAIVRWLILNALFDDLTRKLNDMIKRARLAKSHAYILAEIHKQMPMFLGKTKLVKNHHVD